MSPQTHNPVGLIGGLKVFVHPDVPVVKLGPRKFDVFTQKDEHSDYFDDAAWLEQKAYDDLQEWCIARFGFTNMVEDDTVLTITQPVMRSAPTLGLRLGFDVPMIDTEKTLHMNPRTYEKFKGYVELRNDKGQFESLWKMP